ncbi:unnamed protein product, partial [Didymodactylos carnosus]
GLKVIAFAGAEEKIAWLKNDLKCDYVYNYKKTSLADALKEAAPDGVDFYFDN